MRVVLGILGALVVGGIFSSVLRTLVIPRPTRSGFTRAVQTTVRWAFQMPADRFTSAEVKDRVLAPAASVAILMTLVGWLACFMIGYGLLEAAVSGLGATAALREAGSSMFTLGFASSEHADLTAIDFCAAATGPITIGLQIGYLPALYGAYQRRETEVTLLQARTGSPPWGPQILARYAQVGIIDSIGELFRGWERWSAEVSESHTTYPILIHFRSPKANRNWLVAMLAVMDAAALRLALNPSCPQAEVRMALRAGYVCLREIADVRGIPYDRDPSPDGPVSVTYEDFLQGLARMADQGYSAERTPEEAWPDFRGWRINYEAVAYRLAYDIDAVPAPWSGPRRTAEAIIVPDTPVDRRPVARS
ncbi:hypothetical protein [Actinacidiphila oryziradicis]|uniref:Uncharacterized protein n=1 Tax=Actinacidiphila oryziradicis TaxID=2571141 RepID=A0A4U0RYG6_9ACTN|nr:hypothetical protein [Actinacidiphila oryziradicis]TKA01442.1 hypothetical protein FCI23_40555 [Actinacidiphila oryziradicis]